MGRKLPVISHQPWSLEEVVSLYRSERQAGARAERDSFAAELTFDAAVRRAALALNADGTTHLHQAHWVTRATRQAWAQRLLDELELLRSATTFDDLYTRIESLRIKYVGPLTVYDTAYRIGAKLGLEPELVYLHQGTLEGAVLLGFSRQRPYLKMEELPPAFRALRPYEVEDCLCIYRKDIKRIVRFLGLPRE